MLNSGSDVPHCITPRVGPHAAYSILACISGPRLLPFIVHLTYSGQTTVAYLPRYLGEDGILTYGERTPKPSSAAASSSDSSSSTQQADTTSSQAYGEVGVVTITSTRAMSKSSGARAKGGESLIDGMGIVVGVLWAGVCCWLCLG